MASFKSYMTIAVVFLVIVILISMVTSSVAYVPYYRMPPYASKYEGMEPGMEAGMEADVEEEDLNGPEEPEDKKKKKEGFLSLTPANVSGPGGVHSSEWEDVFANVPQNGKLYAGKLDANEHLDKFLDVTKVGVNGKNGCQSSGLSNSMGELCLPPELIQMLKTRGGNATGN